MKLISERVSVQEKDNVLSVVMLPTTDKKKLNLMLLWLLAWTGCGVIVFINYFKLNNQDAKLFIIIYLSFWFYFEYKIARAWIWKKFGREKIWLKNGKLFLQKEINGSGKIKEYEIDLVNDVKLIELSHASFADTINQSFWIKGGERIQFQYMAKTITFGMQLSDKEAYDVIRELKSYLKNKN